MATARELCLQITNLRMENNTSEGSTSGSINFSEVNLGELKVRAMEKILRKLTT